MQHCGEPDGRPAIQRYPCLPSPPLNPRFHRSVQDVNVAPRTKNQPYFTLKANVHDQLRDMETLSGHLLPGRITTPTDAAAAFTQRARSVK